TQSIGSLVANLPGTYTVELRVSDGQLSDTDTVVVEVGANRAPVADASASDVSVIAGGPQAKLNGTRSSDPDNDVLTYAWRIITSTNGYVPTITNSTKSQATMTVGVAGSYLIELKVGDGLLSDTDYVIVTVRGNQAPVADASLSDTIVDE